MAFQDTFDILRTIGSITEPYSYIDAHAALSAVCGTIEHLDTYTITKVGFSALDDRWYAIQEDDLFWFVFPGGEQVRVAAAQPSDPLPPNLSTPCLPSGPHYSINALASDYVIAAHDGTFSLLAPKEVSPYDLCVYRRGDAPVVALWTIACGVAVDRHAICVWRAGEWFTIDLPARHHWHQRRRAMALGDGGADRVLLLHEDSAGTAVHIVDVATQAEVATVSFDHAVKSIATVGTHALVCFGTHQLGRLDLANLDAPPTMVDVSTTTTLGVKAIVGLATGRDGTVGLLCSDNTCAWLDSTATPNMRVTARYTPPVYGLIEKIVDKVDQSGLQLTDNDELRDAINHASDYELTGVLTALQPTFLRSPVMRWTPMPSLGPRGNPVIAKLLVELGYVATFEDVKHLLNPDVPDVRLDQFSSVDALSRLFNDAIRDDPDWRDEALNLAIDHSARASLSQFRALLHFMLDNGAAAAPGALLRLVDSGYLPDIVTARKLIDHGASVAWAVNGVGSLGSLALDYSDLDFLLLVSKLGYESSAFDVARLLDDYPIPPGCQFERWLWLYGLSPKVNLAHILAGPRADAYLGRARRFLDTAIAPWSPKAFALSCYWPPVQKAVHTTLLVAQRWLADNSHNIGNKIDNGIWRLIINFLPVKPDAWRGSSAVAALLQI